MTFAQLDRHHYAWLSIVAAVVTITLKTTAWWITGSVGLLSDALESFVNLAGASFALWMILITRVPADHDHPFGHGKAEYFSSGFEGILIFGAALAIIWTAAQRILAPVALDAIGWGLAFSAASTVINYAVAIALRRAGRSFNSVALDADSRHLMTDVWTSVGVAAGIGVVAATDWLILDPLIAMAVGVHIMVEGYRLVHLSAQGLMDRAIDAEALAALQAALGEFSARQVSYGNLKTRRAGTESFVHVDILVPGTWPVRAAHDMLDEIESRIRLVVPGAIVSTHLEPQDRPPAP
jgi:cation diffusion facilitator family transporter